MQNLVSCPENRSYWARPCTREILANLNREVCALGQVPPCQPLPFFLTLLCYPLVNIQKTMENHHFLWENSLFLWPFSIAMLNYQRVHLQTAPFFLSLLEPLLKVASTLGRYFSDERSAPSSGWKLNGCTLAYRSTKKQAK